MKTCPTCHGNYSDSFAHCPRDGTPLVEADFLWTEGMVVRGKYQILSKIGQGGMGAVYKALHLWFREPRALKVMSPELMKNQVLRKRFEHEASATHKLEHPNAVRVEDFDEAEDGRPFIVMEYVEGRSLKEAIERQGRLPVAQACAIAKQIASALDAAHRLGMIHRDIKPANILLVGRDLSDAVGSSEATAAERGGPFYAAQPADNFSYTRPLGGEGVPPSRTDEGAGTNSQIGATEVLNSPITQAPDHPMAQSPDHPIAKVLDFGIAKIKEGLLETTGAGVTLTGTGVPIGTPSYMSPEQAMARTGEELDGRSDIYSLGVVMYQMLTGELPLQADTPFHMMMAHAQTPPRPIKQTRHGAQVPDAIARLVMRCLEKDPGRRPPNARALIGEIEYWEEEPARLARAKADQERITREKAEAKRAEQEQAEQERLAREMAKAVAELKAERELKDAKEAELERTARYGEGDASPVAGSPSGASEVLGDATGAGGAEVRRTQRDTGGQPRRPQTAAPREVPPAPPRIGMAAAEGARIPEGLAPPVRPSRRGWAIAAAALGALLLGTAVWYLAPGSTRVTNQPSQQASTPPSTPPTGGSGTRLENPVITTPVVSPKTEEAKTISLKTEARSPARSRSTAAPAPARAIVSPPPAETGGAVPLPTVVLQPPQQSPTELPKTTVDPKAVKQEMTLCQFYYDNGEYDNAIIDCDKGLKLDPSNADLQKLLSKVKNAKATETNQGVPNH